MHTYAHTPGRSEVRKPSETTLLTITPSAANLPTDARGVPCHFSGSGHSRTGCGFTPASDSPSRGSRNRLDTPAGGERHLLSKNTWRGPGRSQMPQPRGTEPVWWVLGQAPSYGSGQGSPQGSRKCRQLRGASLGRLSGSRSSAIPQGLPSAFSGGN